MILWPGGTGPNPPPPQLLFLCWGPSCSLLLLFHGVTITLCTHKATVGFFLTTSGKLLWGMLACRMCADSMCAEAARKARLPQQAQVCGTGMHGNRRAAHFLCLSPSSSKLAQAPPPLPPTSQGPLSMACCPALGHFIASVGPYLAQTHRIFREQVCRRQRGWLSAGG